jgi:hypothetical protein
MSTPIGPVSLITGNVGCDAGATRVAIVTAKGGPFTPVTGGFLRTPDLKSRFPHQNCGTTEGAARGDDSVLGRRLVRPVV